MSRFRAYCFTYNNYPQNVEDQLVVLECVYLVAGYETAPTTGTPHLQGFVYFRNAKTLSAARRVLQGAMPGCHLEPSKGSPRQNRIYCLKLGEGDQPNDRYYERGTLPMSAEDKGEAESQRWEDAWESAKLGEFENIPADIRIRQYAALKRIAQDYMPALERLTQPCGTWIVGQSGAGKTRAVLDQIPDAFPKPRNQWWDGYRMEPVVLVDDLDKFDVRLGGKLKHWADAYPFIAEAKGTSLRIRPQRIIVTSQYEIEEIWTDQETREALLRRFVVIRKYLGQEINLL